MVRSQWVSTSEFAQLAGISRQAAAKAVRLSLAGKRWRQNKLVVRRVHGRGGRRGESYEISLHSFPYQLSIQTKLVREPEHPRMRSTVQAIDDTARERLTVITPALELPRGSESRAIAVAGAALHSGRSGRTLYRWIDQYETYGLRGLRRAKPSNAGQARVFVSREFDRSFRAENYEVNLLHELARRIQKSIKALWASRAESAGSTEIRRLAEFLLQEDCEALELRLPAGAFRLSRRYIERFAHFRVVNQRRNDRKTFDDLKPRIRRDWTELKPMERVIADVKHLDVIVSRPDGTPAWPKIVAFMDAGTGRVFVHMVLLERGEGVRQEHVIDGFLAMVTQDSWGFPQGLYLDNGSEFKALEKIDSALQLINDNGARTLIFAKPYNAAAKPIESLFSRLDRYVFSMLPGYAGPNRMAKRIQIVGKPPKPFPGTWDDFCSQVQGLIAAHNQRPVGGLWGNRSPEEWLAEKVSVGWRPTVVSSVELDAAFARHDSRRVDRGVISIDGERFTHIELSALPSRTVVDLALPWRRGALPLARIGDRWLHLRKDVPYPARWIEGARETMRRQARQAKHVKSLSQEAGVIDPVAVKIRSVRPVATLPEQIPKSKLDLGEPLQNLSSALAHASRHEITQDGDLRRALNRALTERLEKRQKSDG